MLYKKSIVQATQDLENWQRTFYPSWFLITRTADPMIDNYLAVSETKAPTEKLKQIREAMNHGPKVKRGSVFIDGGLIAGEKHRLPSSTAYTTSLTNGDGDARRSPVPSLTSPFAKLHVRDFARRLSNSDPWESGLLHCRGVVISVDEKDAHFQLVFDIPPTLSSPRTLRDLLLHEGAACSEPTVSTR